MVFQPGSGYSTSALPTLRSCLCSQCIWSQTAPSVSPCCAYEFERAEATCLMICRTAFVTGFPFMMTIIFLPQRLQLQYGSSAERAGVQMLALLLLSASGATVGALLCNKWGVAWYLLVASQALQLVGLGLMSSLSATALDTPSVLPGYQVILGIAFGLSLSCLTFIARVGVDDRDISKSMFRLLKARMLRNPNIKIRTLQRLIPLF